MRESVFEDTPVKIPYDYTWLLEEEYSKESLTRTTFERLVTALPSGGTPSLTRSFRHHFNEETLEWEPIK